MNNLLLKSRKVLSILTGILFAGISLHTLSGRMPVAKVEANLYENINVGAMTANTDNIADESQVYKIGIAPREEIETTDERVHKIRKYLESRNSPLAPHAEEFVKAADHYGIDYRIVAAISIIESGGGKKCFKPHNAWGWGKSGFSSWSEGIWEVSKGISKYYSKGMTTPRLISYSYCPPSSDAWAGKVQGVMIELAN